MPIAGQTPRCVFSRLSEGAQKDCRTVEPLRDKLDRLADEAQRWTSLLEDIASMKAAEGPLRPATPSWPSC